MELIKVTDAHGQKHTINTNYIMEICYDNETDLTEIVFCRSAYPSIYVRGDITKQITKLNNVNISYIV